ncbi:HD domain-containing protein [Thermoclostridium stercorarium]|uniref:HD domain-containing protein n=1 Tax=Thermoclostridium stercorarium TaxID=1510 RepID=UPI0022487ADD|nr:HD domain-containing protein [Thermoclostridium stercorarium]UZQ85202.1 HD domain-containing protein [Thermoclostridium stercorarium]
MKQHIVNLGNLLITLSETMDLSNPLVYQHQHRTAYIALEISKNAGITGKQLESIFTAALLHDIGALTVEEKYCSIITNPKTKNFTPFAERFC